VPVSNRLRHYDVSLLVNKGARALFDIQLLPQPARDYNLPFTGEANSVRPRSCLHNLIIAMWQSIVRLY